MEEVNLFSMWSRLHQEKQRSVELDQGTAHWQAVYRSKQQVMRDLAADRLTLLEAAARFRTINQGRSPYMLQILRYRFGNCPEAELCCREVIASLRSIPLGVQDRLSTIQCRLEAELRQHRENGTLKLPAVPTSVGEG
jgi:hypothetical protein